MHYLWAGCHCLCGHNMLWSHIALLTSLCLAPSVCVCARFSSTQRLAVLSCVRVWLMAMGWSGRVSYAFRNNLCAKPNKHVMWAVGFISTCWDSQFGCALMFVLTLFYLRWMSHLSTCVSQSIWFAIWFFLKETILTQPWEIHEMMFISRAFLGSSVWVSVCAPTLIPPHNLSLCCFLSPSVHTFWYHGTISLTYVSTFRIGPNPSRLWMAPVIF